MSARIEGNKIKVWPYLIAPLRVFIIMMAMAGIYDSGLGWINEYDIMAQGILGLYIIYRSDQAFRRQMKGKRAVFEARRVAHYERLHDLAMDNL